MLPDDRERPYLVTSEKQTMKKTLKPAKAKKDSSEGDDLLGTGK